MRVATAAKPIDGTRETIPVREVKARIAYLHFNGSGSMTPAEVAEGHALLDMVAVGAPAPDAGVYVLDGKVNAYIKGAAGGHKLRVRARCYLFNAVYFLVAR